MNAYHHRLCLTIHRATDGSRVKSTITIPSQIIKGRNLVIVSHGDDYNAAGGRNIDARVYPAVHMELFEHILWKLPLPKTSSSPMMQVRKRFSLLP